MTDSVAQDFPDPRLDDNCPVRMDSVHVGTSGFDALISNDNRLFGDTFNQRYSIRSEALPNPLSSMAVWLAGNVGGKEQISGNDGFARSIIPGMYARPGEPFDCTSRDIFKITRGDIERFRRTDVPTANLRRWPVQLGAPVVDGDGVSSNYNLDGGDLPALKGDVMYWWLMSDWSGRSYYALDLEISVSAYTYQGAGAMANTLFLSYNFTNTGSEAIDDAYGAVFATPEFPDGMAGVDTTRAVLFAYNSNDSVSGRAQDVTPAVGVVLLESGQTDRDNSYPPGVRSSYVEMFVGSAPGSDRAYLNTLNGYNASGREVHFGAYASVGFQISGCNSTLVQTLITYPGDPVSRSYWSMERPLANNDACIILRADGTRQGHVEAMNVSTPMGTIPPGQSSKLSFAVVWAQGVDRLDSVRKLFSYADLIHEQRDVLLSPSIESTASAPESPGLILSSVSPNPVETMATLKYSVPSQAHIRIRVFDLMGRPLAEPVNGMRDAGTYTTRMDVSGLSAGTYFVRFEIAHRSFTRSLVVM